MAGSKAQQSDDLRIYRGIHYRSGIPLELTCAGGRIVHVRELHTGDAALDRLPLIAPGLVDLQVNGYGGADLNEEGLQPERFAYMVEQLWSLGVTGFLPTIITNSPETITNLLQQLSRILELSEANIAHTVVGIHLEGPFISPEDGPRGAHDPRWVCTPDLPLLDAWQEQSCGRLRIVTFSPEWDDAHSLIAWCNRHGVIASIGHTAASGEQIRSAAAAGARMSTHLGNGAHPVLPRHPNYLWEQLACDALTACVIADGFHLSEPVMKVFYRAKAGNLILVSDAVALAGMPPGLYQAAVGGEVVLSPEGRLCLAADERLLAGSALPLIQGVERMAAMNLCPWQEAWDMASVKPAEMLGIPAKAQLAPGGPADFLLLRVEGSVMTVHQTVKQGHIVYDREKITS